MEKRVLYVFGGEEASGAEIVIERLMVYNKEVVPFLMIAPGWFSQKLLNNNNKQLSYYIIEEGGLKKLKRSKNNLIGYIFLAVKNFFSISIKIHKFLKKENIQIIHANTIVPASYMLPLIAYSKLFYRKRKWVWSDHDLKYFSRIDYPFANLCYKLYDKTLVVSEAVKIKYSDSEKIEVLYNGLDTNYFKADVNLKEEFRRKYQIEDTTIVMGIAGTISKRKGQLFLIESLNELIEQNKKHDNILVVVAGKFSEDDASYSLNAKEIFEKNSHIKYIGTLSDMPLFYNGCDIIFNASNKTGSEPLGTTIYEAMACEKIVIASNTGGTPEIIENKVDGFLFEPDNENSLKDVIVYVLNNFNDIGYIRENARKKVIEKFSIEVMSKKYNEVIDNLLN